MLPHTAPRRLIDPIVRGIARTGLTPNGVTAIGFIVNAAAALLAAQSLLFAAGIVTLTGSALDLLDGALARATGRASRYGAVFDAVLDRYSEVTVLTGILIHLSGAAEHTGAVLVFASITGSVLVSYVRARAEVLGFSLREGLFTRPERVVLIAAALMAAPWWPDALLWALWILAVLTNLTAIQRWYFVQRLSNPRDS